MDVLCLFHICYYNIRNWFFFLLLFDHVLRLGHCNVCIKSKHLAASSLTHLNCNISLILFDLLDFFSFFKKKQPPPFAMLTARNLKYTFFVPNCCFRTCRIDGNVWMISSLNGFPLFLCIQLYIQLRKNRTLEYSFLPHPQVCFLVDTSLSE